MNIRHILHDVMARQFLIIQTITTRLHNLLERKQRICDKAMVDWLD